jgi:L-ascorbate metabolism protein UlaG (beta-lactamase superfamily)
MKKALPIATLCIFLFFNCKDNTPNAVDMASITETEMNETIPSETVDIIPINHATMILVYKDTVFYIDPVGGPEAFSDQEKPDYILITDIHGDHFDPKTLQGMSLDATVLIVPQAVNEKLPELNVKSVIVMNNGDTNNLGSYAVEAIPMYNLREEALKFHEKGRGNGYILTLGGQRIYISGDTEDIPEMRQLKEIDVAFVCMNLPYTMTVESAASAVLDFKPKKVYPYHYRGTDGMSDVGAFKALINKENSDIEVVQLEWYE